MSDKTYEGEPLDPQVANLIQACLDSDLAQYSFELSQLEQKTVFSRSSGENQRYYQIKAEIRVILKEYAKNAL